MNLLCKPVKPLEGKEIFNSVFSFYRRDLVYGGALGLGMGLVGVLNADSEKIQAVVDGLSSAKIFDFIGLFSLICCLLCLGLCDALDQEERGYRPLKLFMDFTDWCSRKTIDLIVVFFSASVPYFVYVFCVSNELKHKILMPFITVWGILFIFLLAGAFFVLSCPGVRNFFIHEMNPLFRFSLYYIGVVWLVWIFVSAFFI